MSQRPAVNRSRPRIALLHRICRVLNRHVLDVDIMEQFVLVHVQLFDDCHDFAPLVNQLVYFGVDLFFERDAMANRVSHLLLIAGRLHLIAHRERRAYALGNFTPPRFFGNLVVNQPVQLL